MNIESTKPYPYPNPVTQDDIHEIRFLNVPEHAQISIYTISGKKVIKLERDYNSKIRVWDLKNNRNKYVPSGVYIYLIQGISINQLGKISVIR